MQYEKWVVGEVVSIDISRCILKCELSECELGVGRSIQNNFNLSSLATE